MRDPHCSHSNTKTASFSLPPGCRFHPSEEQLIRYYLTKKNTSTEEENNLCGNELIKEVDLYEYEPYELPEGACYAYGHRGMKRHWYCYSKVGVVKESKYRKAKNGFWKRNGRLRDVMVMNSNCKKGKSVLGTRTRLVFYVGNSFKTAVKTDWVMHEYALVDHVKAAFVLFRVFLKSSGGNSISGVSLASAAEESVSAVRHVGVQHDGFLIPDSSQGQVDVDNSIDRRNDTSVYPVSQLDNHVICRHVSDARFQFPAGVPPNEQVSVSGITGTGLFSAVVATQQLLSILEEDFIELDDLVP